MDQQFNDMMKNMKITPAEVDRMTKGKSLTFFNIFSKNVNYLFIIYI